MKRTSFVFTVVLACLGGASLASANPTISGTDIQLTSQGARNTDAGLAYNATSNEYLLVFRNTTSKKILGQRLDGSFAALGSVIEIRSSATFPARPAVAWNANTNTYYVVWDEESADTQNENEIFGQLVTAAGALSGSAQQLSDQTAGSFALDLNPTVAANTATGGFLVAWESDDLTLGFQVRIGARLVSSSGTASGAQFLVDVPLVDASSANVNCNFPAIAYNATAGEYLVVWSNTQNTANPPNSRQILGQRLHASTGAELGTDFKIAERIGAGQSHVAWSEAANRYLIAFSANLGATNTTEIEVFGRLVAAVGTVQGAADLRLSDAGPDGNVGFGAGNPFVTYNHAHKRFLVTWTGDDDIDGAIQDEIEIFGQELVGEGPSVGNEFGTDFRISFQPAAGDTQKTAVLQSAVFGTTSGKYLVAWSGGNGTASEIFAKTFAPDTCGNSALDAGEGCDDGNTTAGDGCSSVCVVEAGFTCPTPGSACTCATGFFGATCQACSPACTASQYEVIACTPSTNRLCGACDGSCATCNGPSSNNCLSCSGGNTLSGGSCVAPNTLPTITAPATAAPNEDESIAFTGSNQVSITDPDPATLSVTLSTSNGTFTITTTTGLTLDAGGFTSSGGATFTGTVANLNAALATLSFLGNAQYNGAAAVTIEVDDAAFAGTVNATHTIALTVAAVNDAPVMSGPVAPSTTEDTALTLSGANAFAVSDVDVGTSEFQMTVTVSDGTATLATTTSLTFTAGDGDSDAAMTFTGTLDDVNAALDGLVFKPTAQFNGTASISVKADDQGATGSGGAKSHTLARSITVSAVNDGPTVSAPGGSFAVTEDVAKSLSGLTFSDLDVGTGTMTATLTVASGTVTGSSSGGVTASGSGTGVLTLSGTLTDLNTYLTAGNATFTTALNATSNETLKVKLMDGGNTGSGGEKSFTADIGLIVTAVNDAPSVTAPVATQAVAEHAVLTFNAGNSNAIAVSDVDATTVTTTLTVTHGKLSLSGTTGLTFTTGDGTKNATMTFSGTPAATTTALDGLKYDPDGNYDGGDTLVVTVSDGGQTGTGGAKQVTANVPLQVNAVNDPPAITAPGAQTVTEDGTFAFTGAGLVVSVADEDAASVKVTLTATDGTVNLSSVTGLSFSAGDGNSDPAMAFTGTLTNVNAALATLSFSPTANFTGATAKVVVDVTDQGSAGSGGAKTDSKTVTFTITAVNDAPTIAAPATRSVAEDAVLTFTGTGNVVSVADVDAASGAVKVTLTPTNGTVTVTQLTGLTFSGGSDGTDDAPMTFTATVTAANNALATLSYKPTADFNGAATLKVDIDDQGNTGGAAQTATKTVTLTVTEVNDTPSASADSKSTGEDTPLTFAASDLTSNDSKGPANESAQTLTVALVGGATAQGGTVALSGGNVTYTPKAHFNGTDTFTYTVTDNGTTDGVSAPKTSTAATVTVTVSASNDAPTAVADSVNGTEDVDVTITAATLLSNDLDPDKADTVPDVLTVTSVQGANKGTVSLSGTTITFKPQLNFNGSGSFQYTLKDSANVTSSATVTVNLAVANDLPVAVDDAAQTYESTPVSIPVLANDTDVDTADTTPDVLTVKSVTQPASGGTVTINGDKLGVTFTRSGSFAGTTTFTYTVTDKANATATATVTVKVKACGDGERNVSDGEACDDGNTTAVDGCAANCTAIEFGFACNTNTPNVCTSLCGDGKKASNEACDDGCGNNGCAAADNGDGCSQACAIEAGFTCTGNNPTVCVASCGSVFNFATGVQDWTITGSGSGAGAFAHGASAFGGGTGFETGLGAPKLPATAVDTTIRRQIAIPATSAAIPKTQLVVSYKLQGDGTNQCLDVFVNPTGSTAGAPNAHTCANATALTTLTVDVASLGGTSPTAVVRFTSAGGAGATAFEGAFVGRIDVRSDVDGDSKGEFGAQAGCDPCIDVDQDGFGAAGSATPAQCTGGAAEDCVDGNDQIFPTKIELCSNNVDDNCNTKTDLLDAQCGEDCTDGLDNGSNGLTDCADVACTGDPFCSPCSIDFTFDSGAGQGFVPTGPMAYLPGAPTQGLPLSNGVWKTGGATGLGVDATRKIAHLTRTFAVPNAVTGGPAPRLEVVYKLQGNPNPAFDVMGVCFNVAPGGACDKDNAAAVVVGNKTPNNALPQPSYTDGTQDHLVIDLKAHLGQSVTVTVFFDTVVPNLVLTPGLAIDRIVVASDVDGDALQEGASTQCDPCWDGDKDGYSDAASPRMANGTPGPSQCPNFGKPDCNDVVAAINPGKTEVCNTPDDDDCDGFLNGNDSDCGTEDCANGKDDNGDTKIDCLDASCTNDAACAVCAKTFTFTTGDAGLIPDDNDPDNNAATRVFQYGASTLNAGDKGWETVLNGNVSSVQTGGQTSVKAFLARTLTIPAGMPFPSLLIRYANRGEASTSKDIFGVCLDPQTPKTQCKAAGDKKYVIFESGKKTASGLFDTVSVPLPPEKAGQSVDVVLFYDTLDNNNNDNPGLFISEVTLQSDRDDDKKPELSGSNACDHCIDADADGYGDATLPYNGDLSACPQSKADCNDNPLASGATTHPDQAEQCAVPGDNDCNGLDDPQELACSVCSDTKITAGETCDDGNTTSGDGCSATCQTEAGALAITEVHIKKLSGLPGEQWIELYNRSNAKIDLGSLGLKLKNQQGQVQTFASDCAVALGKKGEVAAKGFYVIALGPQNGSDGLPADAFCDGQFQLSQVGDQLQLLDGTSAVLDLLDFTGYACELGHAADTNKSRSIELQSATTQTNASNDDASVWCLSAGTATYSTSKTHLGTPGAATSCGELVCDGQDDDCDGTIDQGLPDGDGDKVCNEQDCDAAVATCTTNCKIDLDKDNLDDCKDPCLDGDGDGYGVPGGAANAVCPKTGTDCDDTRKAINPGGTETSAADACNDSFDNDCDGQVDCVDAACTASPECAGETCASALPVACGETKSLVPFDNAFPCGSGADGVLKLSATTTETVTFRVKNAGTKQYSVNVFVNGCADLTCAGSALAVSSTCADGGQGSLSVNAGSTYTLVVDEVAACGGSGSPAADVTVVCGEQCTGGKDEDADGLVDCADDDCVLVAACANADFDQDGIKNGVEILCGHDPKSVLDVPTSDEVANPDNDLLLNCVDPDDDDDQASDATEATECPLNPEAKNTDKIRPGAAKNCKLAGIDADCNKQFDTTEASCGAKEQQCGDGNDNDGDTAIDCLDTDCLTDGICAKEDFDKDGVSNGFELLCNTDPESKASVPGPLLANDLDNDGLPNCSDTDDDADGHSDIEELVCGSNSLNQASVPKNTDGALPGGDTQCDASDLDDDADGFVDTFELGCGSDPLLGTSTPIDAAHDQDADGICDVEDADRDGDTWANNVEQVCGTDPTVNSDNPGTAGLDVDGDHLCDVIDPDDDNDQWTDAKELLCQTDPRDASSVPVDTDKNGVCDLLDQDEDGDGWANAVETTCGTDPKKKADNPKDNGQDADADQLCDKVDPDDDGDNWDDDTEQKCGTNAHDPLSLPTDTDGDKLCDPLDNDEDNDGWLNATEALCKTDPKSALSKPVDTDGDGVCDVVDPDADPDGDLWKTSDETFCGTDPKSAASVPVDTDKDGLCDPKDLDQDADGWPNDQETACGSDPLSAASHPVDTDKDGICNTQDTDDDGDGAPDVTETTCKTDPLDGSLKPTIDDLTDTDGDLTLNCVDLDDDNDAEPDLAELAIGTEKNKPDTDGDGLKDGAEDADHDGVTQPKETSPLKTDTDGDGLSDGLEVAASSCYGVDAQNNCLKTDPTNPDTDGDGLLDGDEDANHNGKPDGDVSAGETYPTKADTDGDTENDKKELFCHTNPLDPKSVSEDKDQNGDCDGSQSDADKDGVSDGVEVYCGTDPLSSTSTPSLESLEDTDGDQIIDCKDPDDDNDLVSDKEEGICGTDSLNKASTPAAPELLDYDQDGTLNCADQDDDDDGLSDAQEQVIGTNTRDQDSDEDGLTDGKEVNTTQTDPKERDTDQDGVQDGTELGVNQPTKDTDATKFKADADPTTKTNPLNPDTDADKLKDGEEDLNGDGKVGDPPESDPLDPTDGLFDTDGDGLTDHDEKLGIKNVSNGKVTKTDHKDPDSDDDGLNDKLELLVYGSDPLDGDSDDGGVNDKDEVDNGTKPLVKDDDYSVAKVIGDNVFRCDASGRPGAGTGALAVLLLAGLVLLARRRARVLPLLVLAALAVPMMAPTGASAQATAEVNIENFMPGGGRYRIWSVEESMVGPKWQPYASVLFYGERKPLFLKAGNHEEILVESQTFCDIGLGVGLADWAQIELSLPVAIQMTSADDVKAIAPVSGAGLGDMTFRVRGKLLNNQTGGFGIGMSFGLTLPTGNKDKFRGDPTVGVLLNTIFDYRTDRTVTALNLGFRFRPKESTLFGTTFGHELTFGLGIDVAAWIDRVHLDLEIFGRTPLTKDFFSSLDSTNLEVLFGPKFWVISGLSIQAAVGAGLVQGYGAPNFRFLAGLQWAPRTNDSDGDGIEDRADECPLSPEDKDGFADNDGCPEWDNDKDGIVDAEDKCPNQAEDWNGVEDKDGCPDGDADGDGVADALDRCPSEREDKDGYQDDDGCPELDNDGDGVQDTADKCPNLPGPAEKQGCPDGGSTTKYVEKIIEVEKECARTLPEYVIFAKGKWDLTAEAKKTLEVVAKKILENKLVIEVGVDGHASEEGNDLKNLTLSKNRGKVVKAELVRLGVEAKLLTRRGFGASKPVYRADNPNEIDYEKNRRTEFTLLLGGKCSTGETKLKTP